MKMGCRNDFPLFECSQLHDSLRGFHYIHPKLSTSLHYGQTFPVTNLTLVNTACFPKQDRELLPVDIFPHSRSSISSKSADTNIFERLICGASSSSLTSIRLDSGALGHSDFRGDIATGTLFPHLASPHLA
jgi:hypothetical protein